MTTELPPPIQPPMPIPYQPPRQRAEMSGMDVLSLIFSVTGFSIIGLILGLLGRSAATKTGLQQHAIGVAGLVIGAIGTVFWSFWMLILLSALAA